MRLTCLTCAAANCVRCFSSDLKSGRQCLVLVRIDAGNDRPLLESQHGIRGHAVLRLELLAVAAPGGEELDQHAGRAANHRVEVVGSELNDIGTGGTAKKREREIIRKEREE